MNYLRFGIQLCALRKSGRFVNDYSQIPIKVAQYLARQLECEPVLFVSQPNRMATEYTYREKISNYLSFNAFDDGTENQLNQFIKDHLHNQFYSVNNLLQKVEVFLLSKKVVLPSSTELSRKVTSMRIQIQEEIYEKISGKVSDAAIEKMKALLSPKNQTLSMLQHYKRYPPEPTAAVMNEFLGRLEVLQQIGVHQIELSDIAPSIIEDFYRLATTYNVRDLKRLKPISKRYALLICFLVESYKTLLDHILNLNSKMLSKKERLSRNKIKKKSFTIRRKAREYEKIMIDALEKLFGHKDRKLPLDIFIEGHLQSEKIKNTILACKALIEAEEVGLLQELDARYPDLRKYTPRFFELDFKGAKGTESVLDAIELLRQLNRGDLKCLPSTTPIQFVSSSWALQLRDSEGNINQRVWELALYFEIKKLIDRGDIYLSQARQHVNFWETTYSEHDWDEKKEKEYEENITLAKNNLNKTSFAYISHKGELKLRRDDALEIPESTKRLRQLIESRLPLIRIEKLIEEVDENLQFNEFFIPQAGYEKNRQTPAYLLHAAIVAHGSNIGIYNMSHSAENITVDELRHASRWLIRQETLKAVNTHLINEHRLLPFSAIYGDATLSSSDAKRYGIQRSSLLASYYPRYFGYYDRAISIYTHTSDLYSVFSTQVISCGLREAVYVLNGLLSNDSLLTPTIHCTDTHGFTHHIFALCYLLGFSFQPRLKDLSSQKLYKLDKNKNYGEIDGLFSGSINIDLIREQWDQLVRIIASLKNQLVPADMIVAKLANRTHDKVSQALTELGKLIKTIFILRYISDTNMRYKIHLQLNRGESRHYLAQHIFFADQGIFKTNDYEEIMNKASCLSFLSNAILYWNTVQISKIVEDLKTAGYPVNEEDLARISPLMFKHVIMHGTYRFTPRVTNLIGSIKSL